MTNDDVDDDDNDDVSTSNNDSDDNSTSSTIGSNWISDYELLRLARIERNQTRLRELGLLKRKEPPKKRQIRPKKIDTKENTVVQPVRRLIRIQENRHATTTAAAGVVAATMTTFTHTGRRHAAPKAGVAATTTEINEDRSIHSKIKDEVRRKMEHHVSMGTPWSEVSPLMVGVRKVQRRSGDRIRYEVQIRCQKKQYYIGSWTCAASAGQAYLYATAAAQSFVPATADASGGSKRRWSEHERTSVIRGMALYPTTQKDPEGSRYIQLAKLVPGRTPVAVKKFILRNKLNQNSKLGGESEERSDDGDQDDDDGTNAAAAPLSFSVAPPKAKKRKILRAEERQTPPAPTAIAAFGGAATAITPSPAKKINNNQPGVAQQKQQHESQHSLCYDKVFLETQLGLALVASKGGEEILVRSIFETNEHHGAIAMDDVLVAIGTTAVATLKDQEDDGVSRLQRVSQLITQSSRPLVITFSRRRFPMNMYRPRSLLRINNEEWTEQDIYQLQKVMERFGNNRIQVYEFFSNKSEQEFDAMFQKYSTASANTMSTDHSSRPTIDATTINASTDCSSRPTTDVTTINASTDRSSRPTIDVTTKRRKKQQRRRSKRIRQKNGDYAMTMDVVTAYLIERGIITQEQADSPDFSIRFSEKSDWCATTKKELQQQLLYLCQYGLLARWVLQEDGSRKLVIVRCSGVEGHHKDTPSSWVNEESSPKVRTHRLYNKGKCLLKFISISFHMNDLLSSNQVFFHYFCFTQVR